MEFSAPTRQLAVTEICKTLLVGLLCGIGGCSYVGLSRGYQQVGGKWAYVLWDEASGRQVRYLEDADKRTLTVLTNDQYAKDKSRVYFQDVLIPHADPETFTLLEFPYAKDHRRAYCGSIPLDPVDVGSFKVLMGRPSTSRATAELLVREFGSFDTVLPGATVIAGRGWATDGQRCFCGPTPLPNADAGSFAVLDLDYAKDKNTAYYCNATTVAGADAASFRSTGSGCAQDQNRSYCFGKPR